MSREQATTKSDANHLVRISRNDDGDATNDNSWHLIDPGNDQGPAALCTQEFFGYGESSCEFETKSVKRGGVTCRNCVRLIKIYKAVKL